MVVIIVLPDWGGLLSFITAATVLVYATAPLALGGASPVGSGPSPPVPSALRQVTAPAAFVIANLILMWVGWTTNSRLFLVVAFGGLIVVLLALVRPGSRHTGLEWLAASWIVPYAGAMCTVSYLSPYGGGRAALSDWGCAAVVASSVSLSTSSPCASARWHIADCRMSIDRSLGGTAWTCRWRTPKVKMSDDQLVRQHGLSRG